MWLVVAFVERGGLKRLLALSAVAVDLVHLVTGLRLGAVVDLLALLRVENVRAHTSEPTIGHDIETVTLIVRVSAGEPVSFPVPSAAEHLLALVVLEHAEPISVLWIFDNEGVPIMRSLSQLASSQGILYLMGNISRCLLNEVSPLLDVKEKLFPIVVSLCLHVKQGDMLLVDLLECSLEPLKGGVQKHFCGHAFALDDLVVVVKRQLFTNLLNE